MTEQIGTHGLSCVTDTDYAAIALAMQCNALAVEDALTQISAPIQSATTRPWIHVVNTVAISVNNASGTTGPSGLIGEAIQPSAFATVLVQSNGIPTAFTGDNFMPQGIYLVGTSVAWTVGAQTANSIRQLLVYGVREVGGTLTTFSDVYRTQDFQGDGGSTGALTTVGFLDTRAGDTAHIQGFFSHANAASNLTIAAGAWRLWAVYLGAGSNF